MIDPLNEREQYLLKALIERHISDGQPVGSKTLAEDPTLSLSSATIRHVLADLEEKGYLAAPHTSAGRVPTARGYRLFVDSLVTIQPITSDTVLLFEQQLAKRHDLQHLINMASSLLSELTHMVGLVTLPRQERFILSHVEFLPLSDKRILAILVFNHKEIQNRIIETEREYQREELVQLANYINDTFSGDDFLTVRQNLCRAMRADKEKLTQLMQSAMDIAEKAMVNVTPEKDYVLAGQTNLMNVASQAGMENLCKLFDAFTQKQGILDLLDRCFHAQGVQIFIGSESNYHALGEYSVITSTYSANEQPVGVLGVIGPTRMPYDRIIPIVDITAKILTSALNQ